MKHKYIILGLTSIVLLSALISVSALAINQFTMSNKQDAAVIENENKIDDSLKITALENSSEILESLNSVSEKTFVDTNADPVRNYTVNDTSAMLTYSKTTVKSSGTEEHIYLDSKNNEYYFNSKGRLLGSRMNIDNYSEINSEIQKNSEFQRITESEAIAIAEKAAREHFGEIFDLVEFSGVSIDSTDGSYNVDYQQRLGDGKFIQGLYCYVNVLPDGTVYSCKMPNYENLEKFDESVLEGITKENLYDDLREKTQNLYRESLIDYQIGKFDLMNFDGKYYIRVGVMSQIKGIGDEEPYYDSGQVYLYELPVA